jgi:hypothetical protein
MTFSFSGRNGFGEKSAFTLVRAKGDRQYSLNSFSAVVIRVARFILVHDTNSGKKMYQMSTKCTKWSRVKYPKSP